jgi:hypothetical protein
MKAVVLYFTADPAGPTFAKMGVTLSDAGGQSIPVTPITRE